MIDQETYSLQVLVEGPSSKSEIATPRHAAPLSSLSLTGIVLPKLPRGAGTAALKKQWEAAGVDAKWTESAYAKKLEKASRRKQLSDFERFKVMRLRKQVRGYAARIWVVVMIATTT
jgi:large subunit ribosomal protein L14e